MCKTNKILLETVNSSTKHHFTTNSIRREVPNHKDGRIAKADGMGNDIE